MMKFKECSLFYGCLLLVSVASCCILFVLEATAEEQLVTSHINESSHGHHHAPLSGRKKLELSDRPSFQDTALRKEDDTKSDERNEIHSSFVEMVASSASSADETVSQVANENNLTPDSATDLGNGITDTGQAVLLTLVESDSSPLPLHTDRLVLSHNVSDLVDNTSDAWTEGNNRSTVAEEERHVIRVESNAPEVAPLADEVPPVLEAASTGDEPITGEDSAKREEPASGGSTQQVPDDIPSFSEWAQKQMEEADRRNVHNASIPPTNGVPLKLRSKNYASPDCGAKIVAANPEALSANSVLSPSRDEYLLNACLNRVWLVIELCDSIQAKKIDIANFELFSSSPKEFSVSVSDRFPSRDWRSVGQFTASDVRDVQSYSLQPHLFGKFVKVEIHSHYGSEHFCPVSLLRVYGTNVMEVLETEEEVHHGVDDEDEAPLDKGEAPRNLYGIARDAVKSIVKAAEALVIRGESAPNAVHNSTTDRSSSTPTHLIVCDNCSDSLFQRVFQLLERRHTEVYNLIRLPFVKDAIRSGPICVQYGLDFGIRRPTTYPLRQDPGDYLSSLFPPHYMAALCNALAVLEKKIMLNASHDLGNITISPPPNNLEGFMVRPKATCSVDADVKPSVSESRSASNTPTMTTSVGRDTTPTSEQIKPTKTLDDGYLLAEVVPPVAETSATDLTAAEVDLGSVTSPIVEAPTFIIEQNATEEGTVEKPETMEDIVEIVRDIPEDDVITDPLDTLLSELKALDSTPATVHPATTTSPPQKESVFVRLSNRIKALERNMSLSGQYLEELSRRYKRQVEEMSRTLNRTLAAVELEAKQREEREKRGEEDATRLRRQVSQLVDRVDSLVTERDGWRGKASVVCQHLLLIAVELATLFAVWYFFRRVPSAEREREGDERRGKKLEGQPKRRKSVDGVSGHRSPTVRRKRPSEVALNITGTYSELLITESPMAAVEGVWSLPKAEPKRRKRKRRDLISKSTSGGFLLHKQAEIKPGGGSNLDEEGQTVAVRRASLSELTSISIPSNGVQETWKIPMLEPCRVQEVVNDNDLPGLQVFKDKSNASVIKVPKQSRTKEILGDTTDLEKRNGSLSKANRPVRRLSSPAFMKTAASSRAMRRVIEVPPFELKQTKLKSDNWEFWPGSRKSSQTNLVPTPQSDPVRDSPSSAQASEKSATAPKKSSGGLKKMVKRFF